MNTNSEKLLVKDEVFQVVGCAIEVLNTLGLMLNYLRITALRIGVILNFKHRIRVGEDCLMKFVSIRVHSWLTA